MAGRKRRYPTPYPLARLLRDTTEQRVTQIVIMAIGTQDSGRLKDISGFSVRLEWVPILGYDVSDRIVWMVCKDKSNSLLGRGGV